jgi:WD40 repeat protein
VAFSPTGGLLAVGEGGTVGAGGTVRGLVQVSTVGAVVIYAVGPTGLSKSTTTVSFPESDIASVAFSPGGLLAAAKPNANAMSVFSVIATGNVLSPATLTPVSGSPFATGSQPVSAAFSSNGLLATANSTDSTISVFKSTSAPLGSLLPTRHHRHKRCVEPKLLGLSARQARRRLAAAGCAIVVRHVHSARRRHGRVIRVSGRPGRKYPVGHKVKVYVGA